MKRKTTVKIKSLKAKEILDSKGMPTVEVKLKTDLGIFEASAPSGVSTGKYEAVELRDDDGKGVKKAVENVEKIIAPVLEKEDLIDQKRADNILIQLDGTKNKSRLGSNAILPVSIAVCRALAKLEEIPLYKYIRKVRNSELEVRNWHMPLPSFNMIEGGKHTHSKNSNQTKLAFQEFMVMPQSGSFKENLEIGKRIYGKLKEILKKKFKKTELSAEGAFAAPVNTFEALDLIVEAGRGENIKIAIDAAASNFYQDNKYEFEGRAISKEDLGEIYREITPRYPVISIEDPFFEEGFEDFAELKLKLNNKILIIGDDLTVSNIERIKTAQEKNACSGLILKPNQIGTITETLEAANLAKSFGWKIMVSNRGGETEDDFIADLAVGVGAEFIKSGAPYPKERMAKYNRLVKIERELI